MNNSTHGANASIKLNEINLYCHCTLYLYTCTTKRKGRCGRDEINGNERIPRKSFGLKVSPFERHVQQPNVVPTLLFK